MSASRRHAVGQGRRSRQGALLMLVLWIVVILSIMAYSLTYELRIGLNMTGMSTRKAKARALARAGVAKAVMDLRNDRLIAVAQQPGSNDSLGEIWALDDDKTAVKMGEGTYTVRIVDEESKFDINGMQFPRLALLKTMIAQAGHYREAEAQEIAFAIIDFIDPDLMASGGKSGDEVSVLTQWGLDRFGKDLPPGWIFRPKNDMLLSIDELMGVPGITGQMLYGNPDKEPTDPIARVDFLRGKDSEIAPEISLSDCLTANTAGNLNINTASPAVIKMLLTAVSPDGTPVDAIVRKIVEGRKDNLQHGAKSSGFSDPSQLVQAGVPADVVQRMNAMYPIGVSSSNFTIYARGDYQGVRHTTIVTVKVRLDPFTVNPDKPDTLGTRDSGADGSIRNQTNTKIDPAVQVMRIQEL